MAEADERKYLESQGVPPEVHPGIPEDGARASTSQFPYPAHTQVSPADVHTDPAQRVMVVKPVHDKTILEGYLLLTFLGFFGVHHFYLRRHLWGVFYLCTFGAFGCGYLFDFFRMPCLVQRANAKIMAQRAGQYHEEFDREIHTDDAYVLWFPLGGFLGLHHFYLNRPGWGILYLCTVGCFGMGWLFDSVRLPSLVSDYNNQIGKPIILDKRRRLDDSYVMLLPVHGFLGAHHFYLGRPCWGVLYICTFGIFGVGWLVDWIRLPWLVAEFNRKIEEEALGVSPEGVVTITVASTHVIPPGGGTDGGTAWATGEATGGAPYPKYTYEYPPLPQHNYNTFPDQQGQASGQDGVSAPPPYSLQDPASLATSTEALQNSFNEKTSG